MADNHPKKNSVGENTQTLKSGLVGVKQYLALYSCVSIQDSQRSAMITSRIIFNINSMPLHLFIIWGDPLIYLFYLTKFCYHSNTPFTINRDDSDNGTAGHNLSPNQILFSGYIRDENGVGFFWCGPKLVTIFGLESGQFVEWYLKCNICWSKFEGLVTFSRWSSASTTTKIALSNRRVARLWYKSLLQLGEISPLICITEW